MAKKALRHGAAANIACTNKQNCLHSAGNHHPEEKFRRYARIVNEEITRLWTVAPPPTPLADPPPAPGPDRVTQACPTRAPQSGADRHPRPSLPDVFEPVLPRSCA